MSSLTSLVIIFTVEGKLSQIIRGGIVGVFFPFMLVINEKYATSDSCLLAAAQNHSAMSVHKLTVHTLDRKQVRFRRPRLLSHLMSLEKLHCGLSSLQSVVNRPTLLCPNQHCWTEWLTWSRALELPTVMSSNDLHQLQILKFCVSLTAAFYFQSKSLQLSGSA